MIIYLNYCSCDILVPFICQITSHFLLTHMFDTAKFTQLVHYLICFTGNQVLFLTLWTLSYNRACLHVSSTLQDTGQEY